MRDLILFHPLFKRIVVNRRLCLLMKNTILFVFCKHNLSVSQQKEIFKKKMGLLLTNIKN